MNVVDANDQGYRHEEAFHTYKEEAHYVNNQMEGLVRTTRVQTEDLGGKDKGIKVGT